MTDVKQYIDENGVQWKRNYLSPQAAVDTIVDPYSKKDFVRATDKKGCLGDLWDRSAEMSKKREEKDGNDIVKCKFYDKYAKKHKGRRHVQEVREEGAKYLKTKGITVEGLLDD